MQNAKNYCCWCAGCGWHCWGALQPVLVVKEVEDGMLYQGHIARSTDSLTLAASYLCNKLKTPMFKVHIKLTIINNKPLCEYTPPHFIDKMLKDVLHSSVKIGSGIKPVSIDILQPPEKSDRT